MILELRVIPNKVISSVKPDHHDDADNDNVNDDYNDNDDANDDDYDDNQQCQT